MTARDRDARAAFQRLRPSWLVFVVAGMVGLASALVTEGMHYDHWGAVPAGLAAVVVGQALASREHERKVRWAVAAGMVASVGAALIRFGVEVRLYGNLADAGGYHRRAELFAAGLREGTVDLSIVRNVPGTGVIDIAVGAVYAVTGGSLLAGFVLFAMLGFIGRYLWYRAFALTVPEGTRVHLVWLLFFFPSLLFWPAAIGKDAWALFALGAVALGTAKLFAGRWWPSVLWLVLGLAMLAVVRPHIALLLAASLAAVLVFERPGRWGRGSGRMLRAALLVVLGAAALALLAAFQRRLGVPVGLQGILAMRDLVTEMTSRGGSDFGGQFPSLWQLPLAMANVYVRPFLWEAQNPQALMTAVEGVFVTVLGIRALAHLHERSEWAELRRRPLLLLCLFFVFGFALMYTSVLNFGILARQRTQALPALFLVYAFAMRRGHEHREGVHG